MCQTTLENNIILCNFFNKWFTHEITYSKIVKISLTWLCVIYVTRGFKRENK